MFAMNSDKYERDERGVVISKEHGEGFRKAKEAVSDQEELFRPQQSVAQPVTAQQVVAQGR